MMSGNDQSVTVLLANSRRHLRLDGLASVGENVHVHQIVNQLKGLDLDLFGKVATIIGGFRWIILLLFIQIVRCH